MKNRNANVDIWRFIFMVCIMIFHAYGNLNYRPETFIFRTGFIYVEFFFILTGYYTAKHYLGERLKFEGVDSIRQTRDYLSNKFRKMCPCYLTTIMLAYAIKIYGTNMRNLDAWIDEFQSFIYNCTLMTSAIPGENTMTLLAYPGQLWYLSSMFICLPVICTLLTSKAGVAYCNMSWIIFVLYYGKVGFLERGGWPNDLLRGFASMSLGVFLYIATVSLNEKYGQSTKAVRIILTSIETVLLLCTIVLTYKGSWALGLIVFMYTIALVLMLSGRTYSIQIKSRAINWLGKISFQLFCSHFVVIYFLNSINIGALISWRQLLTFYLVLSFGMSIVLYFTEAFIKKKLIK